MYLFDIVFFVLGKMMFISLFFFNVIVDYFCKIINGKFIDNEFRGYGRKSRFDFYIN